MTTTLSGTLSRLSALADAATPGPLEVEADVEDAYCVIDGIEVRVDAGVPHGGRWVALFTGASVARSAAADAKFYAACHPALIKALVEAVGAAEALAPLLAAVLDIWAHTVQHTTYVEGVGYTSRSDQQTCHDPEEHSRLAAAEGKAWHDLDFPAVRTYDLFARLHAVEKASR